MACANGGHQVVAQVKQFDQTCQHGVGGGLGRIFRQLKQRAQLADFVYRPARNQPAQGAPKVEHRVDGRYLHAGLISQAFGQLRFGNVYVGQVGHLGDVFGSQGQAVKFGLQQQRAQLLQITLHHL